MAANLSPAQEKIMMATMDCINKEGIQTLTVRKIAKTAGVNSAAINYYFGSKENLIEMALNSSLDEMASLPEEILGLEELPPRERLQRFYEAIAQGVLLWPGLVRAQIFRPLMQEDYSGTFITRYISFLNDIADRIKKMGIKTGRKDMKVPVMQLNSAVIFPCLMPRIFQEYTGRDLSDPKTLRAFISSLLDQYFGSD